MKLCHNDRAKSSVVGVGLDASQDPQDLNCPQWRLALNSPVLAGTVAESFRFWPSLKNDTFPEINLLVSNLPLSTRVPASRPTLPIANSVGPEMVTLSGAVCSHCACVGSAAGFKFDRTSRRRNEPFPSDVATNRKECYSVPENLNSTFQRPTRFCGWVSRFGEQSECPEHTINNPKNSERNFIHENSH